MSRNAILSFTALLASLLLALWSQCWLLLLLIVVFSIGLWHRPYKTKLQSLFIKLTDKSNRWGSWIFAITCAILLISFFNTYLFSIYTLRSSSMEPTYSQGDIFIMNKVVIGPGRSVENINRYHRLRGWSSIKHGNVVVFNFPEGDTIYSDNLVENYHFQKRQYKVSGKVNPLKNAKVEFQKVKKRPRFIKRIIALPGDTLQIIDGKYIINQKPSEYNSKFINKYSLQPNTPRSIQNQILEASFNNFKEEKKQMIEISDDHICQDEWFDYLQKEEQPLNMPDPYVFPFSTSSLWNSTFWGPALVPSKNQTIELSENNIPLYWRIIETYEKNSLSLKSGKIFINGKVARHYTFKMNYYWAAGDNRLHSFDSRYWGFVPENHIIGVIDQLPFSD